MYTFSLYIHCQKKYEIMETPKGLEWQISNVDVDSLLTAVFFFFFFFFINYKIKNIIHALIVVFFVFPPTLP